MYPGTQPVGPKLPPEEFPVANGPKNAPPSRCAAAGVTSISKITRAIIVLILLLLTVCLPIRIIEVRPDDLIQTLSKVLFGGDQSQKLTSLIGLIHTIERKRTAYDRFGTC